jgi:hypothetical protein
MKLARRLEFDQARCMTVEQIDRALADIVGETDPTLKHLKLASAVSSVFREHGIELVVVGGSAIEFYTEGAYVSGDLDMCVESSKAPLTIRLRQDIMARFGASGGPRSWRVAGLYLDVLKTGRNSENSSMNKPKFSNSGVPMIPMNEPISWEDWLRGRRARRQTGNRVASRIIRRPSSSSDKRLRQLFNGRRGLPFQDTEEL